MSEEGTTGHRVDPIYVKLFKGWDTGGNAIFEIRCVCEACLRSTCPVHEDSGIISNKPRTEP